jgi:AraC family transcriptional regulator of adaptative response/methylated-DNA-[protein]-cysteine methyltransferase
VTGERLARGEITTPVGTLVVTASRRGVTSIERLSGRASRATGSRIAGDVAAARHVARAVRELREYFAGSRRRFTVRLDLEATEFRLAAWEELRRIPFGSTISYGEQARRAGRPRAVRAIGSANGANPVPIIVPCHRVVAAGGEGGYSLGIAMKRWLLAHEARFSAAG